MKAYSDSIYASDRDNQKSTFGHFTFVCGNLITWQSEKLARVEVEYHVIRHTSFKMIWVSLLLQELDFSMHNVYRCIMISKLPFFFRTTQLSISAPSALRSTVISFIIRFLEGSSLLLILSHPTCKLTFIPKG